MQDASAESTSPTSRFFCTTKNRRNTKKGHLAVQEADKNHSGEFKYSTTMDKKSQAIILGPLFFI